MRGIPANALVAGELPRSICRVPVIIGSNDGTVDPTPRVDVTRPALPVPAPPAPAVVPPAPPPWEPVVEAPDKPTFTPPPGVPWTTPVFTPRVAWPAFARRISVSAIGRLKRAIAI